MRLEWLIMLDREEIVKMKSNQEYLDEMCFVDENGNVLPKRYTQWMEWISVKDKGPKDEFKHHEPCPEVLVCSPWGIKIGKQWQSGEWVDDHLYSIDGVTHWMPLPPSPPEKQDN